jgi:hypothetical protein
VTTAGIGEFDLLTDKQLWSVSGDGTTLARELESLKQTFVYYKQ